MSHPTQEEFRRSDDAAVANYTLQWAGLPESGRCSLAEFLQRKMCITGWRAQEYEKQFNERVQAADMRQGELW